MKRTIGVALIVQVLGFLMNPSCKIVHGIRLTDGSFVVSVETDSGEEMSKCIFPETIHLHMTSLPATKINTTFHMRRHINDPHLPLYSWSSNDLTRLRSIQNQQRKTFYFSQDNDANLEVTCHEKPNNKRTYNVEGLVVVNNQEYLVQRLKTADMTLFPVLLASWGDHRVFVKCRRLVRTKKDHDYINSEKSIVIENTDQSQDLQISRWRRSPKDAGYSTSFTVDVLAVVDYSVYKSWYTGPVNAVDRTPGGLQNDVRNYYDHVIKGVDLRYKNIENTEFQIHVVLSGIVIIETLKDCPWINGTQEYNRETESGNNDLNAEYALKAFKLWTNETEGLPAHDHAVLFTKYDLYTASTLESTSDNKISQTSGLAFIGTLCDPGDSVSIVEEQGGYQSVGTVAHEIGHSLGALHDGENNTCRSENRYIMAASGFGPVPEMHRYNPWFFSDCSVEYFRRFIAKQLTEDSTCLLDTHDISKKSSVLPGQLFNPDEQCRMIWGPTSYLCRGAEFGNSSSICTSLYCRDPSTVSDCVLHTAARGTSCGNKQWCQQGHCVFSTEAPSKTGSCLLGDQPGSAFNGMTCKQLVSVSPSYCYQDKVRARCCESCGAQHTLRRGCEYGDRIQGCRPWHCSLFDANRDIKSECCSTCNHGDLMTITEATPHNNNIVTELIYPINRMNDGVCEDHDVISWKSCAQFIKSRGRYACYDDFVSRTCCRSCLMASRDIKECTYGDRTPDLCSRIANTTKLLCSRFRSHCCESCVQVEAPSRSTSVHGEFPFLAALMAIATIHLTTKQIIDFG